MTDAGALTIGVDARELLGDATGVGRYLGELLKRWVALPDAAERRFLLYTPEPLPFLATLPANARVKEVVAGSGTGTWWEQTHLRRAVRADRPDVFFAPAYTAPLALGVPLVVTIHDVSFAAHPEWFTPREGARRRLLTRQAARAASLILTDSDFSRREILDRLSAPPERLVVIPPGVTGRPHSGRKRRDPVVLFVGSIFNRRHLPETIVAFAEATVKRPEARLLIVGADRSYPRIDLQQLADAAGVGERTEIHRYVPDADLDVMYARAAVFVFLSEYEGFGLTPLEALSAGIPIVVLDTPVSREIYGDAAWYVSADNSIRGASEAIATLMTDERVAASFLSHAPAVLGRYSWDEAAGRTLAAITQVGERA
jgi:glycosyltransferase involved in cell wall biosynthesis